MKKREVTDNYVLLQSDLVYPLATTYRAVLRRDRMEVEELETDALGDPRWTEVPVTDRLGILQQLVWETRGVE